MSTPTPGSWIEDWLSAPRFAPYLSAMAGDRAQALELYEWNVAMSAAVLHDLAHLEVGLRNAYDRGLQRAMPAGGGHWVDASHVVFPPKVTRARNGTSVDANRKPREQVAYARREAGAQASSGKVIAELMFGFWRYLSAKSHAQALWVPHLHREFVPGTGRRDIDDPVGRLHKLRNRVAHHEPLLATDLAARLIDVEAVAAAISPDLAAYVAQKSTWPLVLGQRP